MACLHYLRKLYYTITQSKLHRNSQPQQISTCGAQPMSRSRPNVTLTFEL